MCRSIDWFGASFIAWQEAALSHARSACADAGLKCAANRIQPNADKVCGRVRIVGNGSGVSRLC